MNIFNTFNFYVSTLKVFKMFTFYGASIVMYFIKIPQFKIVHPAIFNKYLRDIGNAISKNNYWGA